MPILIRLGLKWVLCNLNSRFDAYIYDEVNMHCSEGIVSGY